VRSRGFPRCQSLASLGEEPDSPTTPTGSKSGLRRGTPHCPSPRKRRSLARSGPGNFLTGLLQPGTLCPGDGQSTDARAYQRQAEDPEPDP